MLLVNSISIKGVFYVKACILHKINKSMKIPKDIYWGTFIPMKNNGLPMFFIKSVIDRDEEMIKCMMLDP